MENKNISRSLVLIISLLISILTVTTSCNQIKIAESNQQKSTDSDSDIKNDNNQFKIAWYATAPHPFFGDVLLGIEAFENEYNIEVEKQVGPDWKQSSENENVEALVAKGYKYLSIYPTDAKGANGLFEEISKKGCRIVNFGATTIEPTKADIYVGSDVKAAAMEACEELIRQMGGKGNIINVLEILEDSNTELRKQGIEEVLKKHTDVKIIKEISGMKTVEEAVQKISDSLAGNIDNIGGIIATGHTSSVGVAQVLTEYKKLGRARNMHFIGINLDPIVVNAIKDGVIDGVVAQNTYGMGYLSCLVLKYLHEGWKPKNNKYTKINTGTILANKDNIDSINDEFIKMTMNIKDSLERDYLEK